MKASVLVVSFSSDWLYTEAQARELSDALRRVGRPVEEHRVQAVYGHDSFLVEVDTMTTIVGGYLRRHWASEAAPVEVQELAS
jgi:homoserine O-acetyltransferase